MVDGDTFRLKLLLVRVAIRPAQIFLENWDKLHGEVWAKSCLETNFQPIRMSFDHPSEASKLAIFKAF